MVNNEDLEATIKNDYEDWTCKLWLLDNPQFVGGMKVLSLKIYVCLELFTIYRLNKIQCGFKLILCKIKVLVMKLWLLKVKISNSILQL
jgi:hypothetical protein